MKFLSTNLVAGILLPLFLAAIESERCYSQTSPWAMHIVDDASRGADGVRLGDADKDGRTDVVTGWEEGGKIRVCFQPTTAAVQERWPSIRVGNVASPEDAVFADINSDGWLDVVSCCEGREQAIYIHINPGQSTSVVRDASKWKTILVKQSRDVTRWMFCEPLGDGTLIIGSKEPSAQIVQCVAKPDGSATFTKLRECGWIMSLRRFDVDSDGDADIVYSDRKGTRRAVGWLENAGDGNWNDHLIGGTDVENMFLDVTSVDGRPTVFCNTKSGCIVKFTPKEDVGQTWKESRIPHPKGIGTGKGVATGDIDGDGIPDLACTCEHSNGAIGVYWLRHAAGEQADLGLHSWQFRNISGSKRGVKFDRLELVDLDRDGDLDLLTCEERHNLGVIWYENPAVNPP